MNFITFNEYKCMLCFIPVLEWDSRAVLALVGMGIDSSWEIKKLPVFH